MRRVEPAVAAVAAAALCLALLAPAVSAFDFQNDFWKRNFGFGGSDLLREFQQGLHHAEQKAVEEAHSLRDWLGWLGGRTSDRDQEREREREPLASEEEDSDEEAQGSDEDVSDVAAFGDSFFNVFTGSGKPWWKGPNVCVEREEIDEGRQRGNDTDGDGDGDDGGLFGSYQFSSCQQTPNKYICRTKMSAHGVRKTFVVKYQCCYGHRRVPGQPGCTRVDMRPLLDTLDEVGGRQFVQLARAAGLAGRLQDANVTAFAPSDDAVRDFSDSFQEANQVEFYAPAQRRRRAAGQEQPLSAKDVVLSHLTPGFIDLHEVTSGQVLPSELGNSSLRVGVYAGAAPGERLVTVNCARVTSANNYASDGVAHMLDRVVPPATRSLAQLLQEEDFSAFRDLLDRAELLQRLSEPGHWTVFAPSNAAFDSLDEDVRTRLQKTAACAANVAQHHVVPHAICSAAVHSRAAVTALGGGVLQLERRSDDGKLFVDDTQLAARDVVATNGVLHVLDAVLVPDAGQPASRVLASHNLTRFRALLDEAGLTDELDAMNNVTLWVPTDEALERPEAQQALDDARADPARLRELLLFHAAGPAAAACDLADNQQLRSAAHDLPLRVNLYNPWPFFSGGAARATVECARVLSPEARACGGMVRTVDRLLQPPQRPLLEELEASGNFSVLLRLIEDAGLASELKENAPFTLLAPPDSVFHRLDEEDLSLLLNDTELAGRMLRQHVLPEMLCCAGVSGASWPFVNRVQPLAGPALALRRDAEGRPHVGSAAVSRCDLVASDGVAHVVNRIMVPMRRKNKKRNPNVEVFLYGL